MVRLKIKTEKLHTSVPARRQQNKISSSRLIRKESSDKDNRNTSKSRVFRRNRTLLKRSGSEAGDTSLRAKTHQLRSKRRSIGWLLLGSLGVAAVVGFFVYQLTAEVTVSLRGSLDTLTDANQANYRQTIDDYFSKRPLERIRSLVQPAMLSQYLQQNGHSEVADVASVDFMAIGKTSIVLEVREPVARWIVDDGIQFVDKSGVIFSKNYFSSPHIKIVDKSGVTLKDTQTATSGRFLSFIGQSIGAIEKNGYQVKEAIIPPSTTRQTQLRIRGGALIKMAIDRSVGEQAEDAARAIKYLSDEHKKPDYIDVRIAGKAYYR